MTPQSSPRCETDTQSLHYFHLILANSLHYLHTLSQYSNQELYTFIETKCYWLRRECLWSFLISSSDVEKCICLNTMADKPTGDRVTKYLRLTVRLQMLYSHQKGMSRRIRRPFQHNKSFHKHYNPLFNLDPYTVR